MALSGANELNLYRTIDHPTSALRRCINKSTRKQNLKFRQIGHTTSQYGQSVFPKPIST